jgi:hypothetical protein
MRKHKKLIISLCVSLIVVLILHFVPFDSRTGYLDRRGANICVGYTQPVDHTYRWITGGVNQWDDQLSYLHPDNPGCAEPAHLKLYLL